MKVIILIIATFAALVLAGQDDICWLRSYNRGSGVKSCPKSFNKLDRCYKPKSISRRGYVFFARDNCPINNLQGCEMCMGQYYPKCPSYFQASQCNTCQSACPSNMDDRGTYCELTSLESDATQCYTPIIGDRDICYYPCKDGFRGLDSVCWDTCPADLDQCGALCVPKGKCTPNMYDIGLRAQDSVTDLADLDDRRIFRRVIYNTAETMWGLTRLTYPVCK